MKDRDLEQLQTLVAELDIQLRDSQELAEMEKSENAQLAAEMIQRCFSLLSCFEGSLPIPIAAAWQVFRP